MSTGLRVVALAALVLALWLAPDRASAAKVLFVSDGTTDLSIADVLTSDGHDVTSVQNDYSAGRNATFHGDLSGYDCIVWSASSAGLTTPHTDTVAFSNLHDFVSSGGSVFVTGYGAVGYGDANLVAFLGGTSGRTGTGLPQAIASLDTNLTTGVVDIRGVVPRDYGGYEYESLDGLGTDTLALVVGNYDPTGAQWSIRSLGDGHVAWVAGVDGLDAQWTNAASGGDGAFNAALRNFVAASTGTASVPGAPRIAFNSPFAAVEGAPIHVSVRVTDPEGDSFTFSWDLDHDGTYGEMPGIDAVDIPAGTTDGPGELVVAVEASDGVHTSHHARSIAISNVAPVVTSDPPTTAALDQHVRYALVVVDPGGVHDPLTFTLRDGPSTAIVTPDGVFDWTPSEADITAAGASRPVAIDVDDGDGGTATQAWSVVVIDDHAPTDPTLLFPGMDAPLLIPGIHLAIGNSSDLDGDPITYTFDLATSATFESDDLQTSGVVTDDPSGITEWRPDESGLHYGRWYWRVSASDGRVTTSPLVSSFLLVPDPTMFPDTGPIDGGADGGPVVASPRGCGCGLARPRPVFPALGAIVLGLALALARRRARR